MVFVTRRLLASIPVLLGVTLVACLLIHMVPGDPAQEMLFGSSPTPGGRIPICQPSKATTNPPQSGNGTRFAAAVIAAAGYRRRPRGFRLGVRCDGWGWRPG